MSAPERIPPGGVTRHRPGHAPTLLAHGELDGPRPDPRRLERGAVLHGRARRAARPPASTSRSPGSGRCGTSPTARSPQREVAAYEVSEATGWGLVPPTVLRDGPYGAGHVPAVDRDGRRGPSCSPWCDGEEPGRAGRPSASPRSARAGPRCWCTPTTTAAPARRARRRDQQRRPQGRPPAARPPTAALYGIDHGVTFHAEDKLRTLLWGWAGEPLTDEARRGARRRSRPPWTGRRLAAAAARAAHRRRGRRRTPARGVDRLLRPAACTREPVGGELARHPLAPVLSAAAVAGSAGSRKTPPAIGRPVRTAAVRLAHDMHAWPASEVPALPGRAATCGSTTPRPAARSRRPRSRRPDLRLRHHAVRRHPPGPRGDLHRLRPAATASGATPGTRCTTSRTSPTSTTRCWSGPSATASTGASSPSARPSCSART